jgi:hypothetical protein
MALPSAVADTAVQLLVHAGDDPNLLARVLLPTLMPISSGLDRGEEYGGLHRHA